LTKEEKYRVLLQVLAAYYRLTGDAVLCEYLTEYAGEDWSGEKGNITQLSCVECHFALNV